MSEAKFAPGEGSLSAGICAERTSHPPCFARHPLPQGERVDRASRQASINVMSSMNRASSDGVMAKTAKATEKAPETLDLVCAEADLIRPMMQWLAHLRAERRLSPKTLEAYARDVRQCLQFLSAHFGERVSLSRFSALEATDIRAFMAMRRAEDIGSRSLMRALAGLALVRPFFGTRGRGQGRRVLGDPGAEDRQEPAEAAADGRRQTRHRCR